MLLVLLVRSARAYQGLVPPTAGAARTGRRDSRQVAAAATGERVRAAVKGSDGPSTTGGEASSATCQTRPNEAPERTLDSFTELPLFGACHILPLPA